ncbi:MAG: TIM barrel protein [Bacteroidales bacterium]
MISNRRNFILTAAASAAAVMLPGYNVTSEQQKEAFTLNRNPLKLGLMTYLVGQKWDIETIIRNCRETQFEHVQLRTTHAHGVEVTLTPAQRTDVKKKFKDAGIAISLASAFQYHSTDSAELRKNIEGTRQYLQLAADVGALGIRVFPNAVPNEGDQTREKILEQIGKSVSECAATGYNLGVQVRVEEHGQGTANIPVIRKILDYSDNPHIYMIWNNSDSDYTGEGLPKGFGGMSLEAQFNLVKDRIGNVHLRELFTVYPWRQLFSLLSQSEYKGYCDIELSDESCEPVRMMKNYRVAFLALQNAI